MGLTLTYFIVFQFITAVANVKELMVLTRLSDYFAKCVTAGGGNKYLAKILGTHKVDDSRDTLVFELIKDIVQQ